MLVRGGEKEPALLVGIVQPLWKSERRFLRSLETEPLHPATQHRLVRDLSTAEGHPRAHVHCGTVHSSRDDGAGPDSQRHANGKEKVILFSHKKNDTMSEK